MVLPYPVLTLLVGGSARETPVVEKPSIILSRMCLNLQFQASCECHVIPHAFTAGKRASLFQCGITTLYMQSSGETACHRCGYLRAGARFHKITYKSREEEVS